MSDHRSGMRGIIMGSQQKKDGSQHIGLVYEILFRNRN